MDYIVVDVETVGEPWDGRLLTLAASCGDESGAWLGDQVPDEIWQMIADPKRAFVSHSKYDARWLRMTGHEVTGPYHDTMKMGHILNENQQLSLEAMAKVYLGVQMDKRLRRKDNQVWFKCDDETLVPIEEAPEDQLLDYCRRDTLTTQDLYLVLKDQLTSTLWLDYWLEEEVPFTEVLLDMECRGMPINLDEAEKLKEKLEVDLVKREENLTDYLGYSINFGSPDQLGAVLFTDLWQQEDRIEITKEQRDCLRARCSHEDGKADVKKKSKESNSSDDEFKSVHFTFPSDLEVLKVGTKYATVQRYRKGLGLTKTPPTELTKKPSTRSGDLVVQHGKNEFVQKLLEYRKIDKVIGTYLSTYEKFSCNEKGETFEQAKNRINSTTKPETIQTRTVPSVSFSRASERNDEAQTICGPSLDSGAEDKEVFKSSEGTGASRQREQGGQQAREPMRTAQEYPSSVGEHSTDLELGRFRLYGTFNQAGTVTGRLSSARPNLENQPAHGELGERIRHLFQGRLAVGDHSQLEPRLMAHFSNDPVLRDIYLNGRDIYLVTANYIFGREVEKHEPERQLCKTLLLAMGYGAGARKLAQILTVNGFPSDQAEAAEYLAHLESIYRVFFGWKKWTIREAKEKGYVKTLGGRIRRLRHSFGDAAWKARSKGERQAVNSIIQGSAGDIMRRNMLDCRAYEPALIMLNQVHDELIFEVDLQAIQPNTLVYLQETCENPGYDISVPLKFEPSFCDTWADKGEGGLDLPDDWSDDE